MLKYRKKESIDDMNDKHFCRTVNFKKLMKDKKMKNKLLKNEWKPQRRRKIE